MTAQVAAKLVETDYAGPHRWQTHGWARLVRRAMRRRAYTRWVDRYCQSLTVSGRENLARLDGPSIVIANHQSHLDSLVLLTALPDAVKNNFYFGAAADRWFVKGKKKLILQPWYQSLVLGNFPIRRGGGSQALDYAKTLLKNGCNIGIFPEGTRATDGQLGQFRKGVALLALELDVPVVPVYLSGLREMRPKGQLEVTPGHANVEILEPLRFAAGTGVAEATTQMWRRMNERHVAHYPPAAVRHAA